MYANGSIGGIQDISFIVIQQIKKKPLKMSFALFI